jgi:CheY-like chemotaxis protein
MQTSQGMTILIVEDNHEMRRIIKAIVGDLAHRIEECGNGSEALAAYRECRPDWVLMDIRLPGLDGIGAVRQIRSRFPEAQAAMVTQYDDEDLRRAARVAGACEYVLKDDLIRLRRLLSGEGN